MTWTVRTVFQKPGGDPLYEFFTTFPHQNKGSLKDPRILRIGILRNLDRSVGLIFMHWENKQSYKQWQLDHEFERGYTNPEIQAWASARNITLKRQQPKEENQNWLDPKYIVSGILGYSRVTLEQIVAGE